MSKPRIFVSVACLADRDLIYTLQSMFLNASDPTNVVAGVCLQADETDTTFDCLVGIRNIRLSRISYKASKGPIYARYLTEQLLQDEDYYFQIDCHTRFFENWDKILISELDQCRQYSQAPVISHYPMKITEMKDQRAKNLIGQVNRFSYIGEDNIRSHGSLVRMPSQPLLSIGISAAMLFMDADTKRSVPYDPNLHFGLHAAEQLLYAVRLWTHGVDIFAPTKHVIATEYESSRDRVPEFIRRECNILRGSWPSATWSKVRYLLGLEDIKHIDDAYRNEVADPDFAYGMGVHRTIFDYYHFSGLHSKLLEVFPYYRYQSHRAQSSISKVDDSKVHD